MGNVVTDATSVTSFTDNHLSSNISRNKAATTRNIAEGHFNPGRSGVPDFRFPLSAFRFPLSAFRFSRPPWGYLPVTSVTMLPINDLTRNKTRHKADTTLAGPVTKPAKFDRKGAADNLTLAPSEGERDGVRGPLDR